MTNKFRMVAVTSPPNCTTASGVSSSPPGWSLAQISAAAEQIARKVGIQEIHSALLPADKLRIISEVESSGVCVCMLGDGVNDAPTLRQAYIGVAMGGMGSEIARDAAAHCD